MSEYVVLAKSRINNETLHIRPEALIAKWQKIRSHYFTN